MDVDPRIMDTIGGVRSEAESEMYLRRNLAHWERHGFGLWMLQLRDDGAFIGRAALRRMPLGGDVENVLGYALQAESWGMGYGSEIARAIVEIAFRRLGVNSVVAGALPDNVASRRILEKLGGRFEKTAVYKNAPHVIYRITEVPPDDSDSV